MKTVQGSGTQQIHSESTKSKAHERGPQSKSIEYSIVTATSKSFQQIKLVPRDRKKPRYLSSDFSRRWLTHPR
jgi:hypothetical protein